MMKKFWISMVSLGVLLSGCGQKSTTSNKQQSEKVNVGILQYVEHSALDAARMGFIDELAKNGFVDGENITINYENAQADQSNLQLMAEKLAKQNTLNLAIATPAAQALQNVGGESTTVFTAVTDPVGAGLIDSMENPKTNMTGTSDASPIDKQIELLLKVKPNVKKVGILYTATEINSEIQAKSAKSLLEQKGIEVVVKTLQSTNDVVDVTTTLANQVEAIFIPLDNIISATAQTVAQIARDKKVPIIGGSQEDVKAGTLMTYGTNYDQLGRQTAKLALEILNGKPASQVSAQYASGLEVIVNEETARIIGVDVSKIKE